MLKKEVIETNNRVSLGLKCADCIHLEKGPPAFEKLCIHLGQQPFSDACPEFTPDWTPIAIMKPAVLQAAAELARSLSQAQTRKFAYFFRNADLCKKAGLGFMDEVVFSTGGDYLECYVRGLLVGCNRAATQCYIVSDMESLNGGGAALTLLRTSVMSLDEFRAHRKGLVSRNRITEPKREGSNKKTLLQVMKMSADERALYRKLLQTKPDEYVPPSLDTVSSSWLDNRVIKGMVKAKPMQPKAKTAKSSKEKNDGSFSVRRYAE